MRAARGDVGDGRAGDLPHWTTGVALGEDLAHSRVLEFGSKAASECSHGAFADVSQRQLAQSSASLRLAEADDEGSA